MNKSKEVRRREPALSSRTDDITGDELHDAWLAAAAAAAARCSD
jgi:hypothetical protein